MGLVSWFRRVTPSDADIRAEIWKLGTRHRGYPLQGALDELKAPELLAQRVVLLRACVRALRARPT